MLEPTGVLRSQHAAQSIAGNVQLAGFEPAPPSQLSHSSSRHICVTSLISPSFHSLACARASSCLFGLVAPTPFLPQSHLCLGQSFRFSGSWDVVQVQGLQLLWPGMSGGSLLHSTAQLWHFQDRDFEMIIVKHSDTIIQPLPTPPGYLPQSLQAVL